MAASDTPDIEFTNISAQPLGGPGRYIDRPGFAHGGAGVAACWYGGARGVARTLLAAAAERDIGAARLRALRLQGAMSIPVAARSARPKSYLPPKAPGDRLALGMILLAADRAAVAMQPWRPRLIVSRWRRCGVA